MKNIASNEIDGHGVFTSGGDVGFVAGLVATILPMFVAPLFMDDVDAWTFPKSISTLLFGSSAAEPPTGFDAGPVLAGLGIHLFVATLIGAVFSLVIAYFDVDTLAPTVVVAAFMLAVLAIDLLWLPLSKTVLPALDDVSIVFTGSMIVWFGLMLGIGIQRWRQDWDESVCPVAARGHQRRLLVAHERAIIATSGMLVLVIVGMFLEGLGAVRWGVATPYLIVHALASVVVLSHALGESHTLADTAADD
ncbi:MAG: hypothetical protein KDC46_09750 [Thermoleophilia bacterium]|nr:hypothetical protein [Thermoleophilia bacterium]